MTVLLVDDEPGFIDALAASLEARGYGCIIATNMSDGVKQLGKYSVNVVVTDIMMPPGSAFKRVESDEAGFHFIEYIQQNWPNLPIVCLSVIADQAKIRLLTARGVRYLRKGETPLDTAIEVITAVAEKRRVRLR